MNIFDLWDRKICDVGQFWLCMAIAGLAFLAGWKVHKWTLLENQPEQQVLETHQEIVEILGEEWRDAQKEDLVVWDDGSIYILTGYLYPGEIRALGPPPLSQLFKWNPDREMVGKVTLIKQGDPTYHEKAAGYIQQTYE